MRDRAYTLQDELLFVRGLGDWSNVTVVRHQTTSQLVAGYIRAISNRTVGFTGGAPLTADDLRRIRDEVYLTQLEILSDQKR